MVVWSLIALIYIDTAILAWAGFFTGDKLVDCPIRDYCNRSSCYRN